MRIRWRLRMAAAQREVWTGAQLRRLLAEKAGLEMSAPSVSALLTKEPSQVKLSTLAALCTALECTPNDLIEVDTTPVERPARRELDSTSAHRERNERPRGGPDRYLRREPKRRRRRVLGVRTGTTDPRQRPMRHLLFPAASQRPHR